MPTSAEADLPADAGAEPTVDAASTTGAAPTRPGHIHWLSWARIVAIVAVVTVHVCAHLTLEWGTIGAKLWHFGNLAESAGRFAVPLFVMVSGATLLPPRPGERLRDFYRRRSARIAVPLVGWTAGYLVLDAWLNDRAITSYTFVQGFAWGRPYYHLYFLYVVAGLYLVTPFLRAFVATADRRLLVAGTAVCLGLAVADKAQHLLMGGGGFNAFSYFVPFLGYYLLGYVVATARPRRPRRTVLAWAAGAYAAAVLVTAAGTWWLFGLVGPQDGRPLYDYYAPTVLVASVAMAYGLRAVFGDRAPNPARARLVRRLADLTFGVFLLHPIPLELLVRRRQPAFTSDYADMAFHVGVVAALVVGCGLVTLLLRQVPVVRRLF